MADRAPVQPPADTPLRVQRVKPAYQQVADELRRQIVAGALKPGHRLPSEADLAQLFGVGRGTVREALRLLVSRQLVETTRGVQGGSFVSTPDPAQLINDLGGALGVLVMTPKLSVADLLEARLLLEPTAARLAAERADDQAVAAVQRAARTVHDASDPGDFTGHVEFHTAVLLASGNSMLALMLQPISDVLEIRLERSRARDAQLWNRVDECHLTIADAVARRDGQAAQEAMAAHLQDLQPLYEQIDILGPDSQ
jgi:GntR family transcriptional repressor for pyruvate dehydrogenase complex